MTNWYIAVYSSRFVVPTIRIPQNYDLLFCYIKKDNESRVRPISELIETIHTVFLQVLFDNNSSEEW